MLLKLIFYGIGTGNRSSRKIARLAAKDLGGMMLCGGQRPSWRTIARFIKDNQNQVHDLFLQVLQLCIKLGMVNFGHLSLDGTKIKANASRHSAMSAGRMKKEMANLAEEIVKAFEELRNNDIQETQQFGDKTSDELPDDLQILTTRKDGTQQSYNHQIMVDSQERVITAYTTSSTPNDTNQMDPTLKENKANTSKNPEKLSADTGYFSGPNLEQLKNEMIDGYVCPEKKVDDFDKANLEYDSERDVYILS
jgi:transposase